MSRHSEESNKHTTHPPMSRVIKYSSTLRAQAVDTLESGLEHTLQQTLVLKDNESIIVWKAASDFVLTPEQSLSGMRQEDVGGG